jgi:putative phosphoribosyl transferase
MRFRNRTEAGQFLAEHLVKYRNQANVLVLALPRGGVPVGLEVAHYLHVPLDVFLVRKLGVPGLEELAIGAIAMGGIRVLNNTLIRRFGVSREEIDHITLVEKHELERRQLAYRGDRPLPDIYGRTVILVDDGLATGATMRAAVLALRRLNPARMVIGVPAASAESCEAFRVEVDEMVCLFTPEPFRGVGLWYENFPQLTDDEVRAMLRVTMSGH